MTDRATSAEPVPTSVELHPRRVRFEWEETPLHWVPGDPFTTHLLNVLHMLLPAGERWFVHVYKQALPLIRDQKLYDDVKGFMGQEGTHAAAHQRVLEHMKEQGLDPDPYVEQVEWMFTKLLGDDSVPPGARDWWLLERVAIIAAIEHFTAVLGQWILHSRGLDRAGADPVMLDLLRWHGAEEVEHRSVAYDVFNHVDGGYARRLRAMALTVPVMTWLWQRGVLYLVTADPNIPRARPRLRDLRRAIRGGMFPRVGELGAAIPRYLRPRFHPSQEGSLKPALDYIERSPAHRAYEAYVAERAARAGGGKE